MATITGLVEALARLGRIDLRAASSVALERAAERVQSAVQETLSHTPGEEHSAPWLRTGTLRASIERQSDDQAVVIGSNDPVAVYQELGTRTIPPRPFLAATASAEAEAVVQDVAAIIALSLES